MSLFRCVGEPRYLSRKMDKSPSSLISGIYLDLSLATVLAKAIWNTSGFTSVFSNQNLRNPSFACWISRLLISFSSHRITSSPGFSFSIFDLNIRHAVSSPCLVLPCAIVLDEVKLCGMQIVYWVKYGRILIACWTEFLTWLHWLEVKVDRNHFACTA